MTARAEQETTITWMRDDDVVRIHTSNFSHLHHLRKLVTSRAYVIEVAGGDSWGDFQVDAAYFHLLSAIRAKRGMSDETRAKRAAVLAAHREAVSA